MDSLKKFSLKWNDFRNNLSTSFHDLWQDTTFSDVTLVGEGNHQIRAHKIIIAASSPVIKNILKQNIHPHPIIYMRGIKSRYLVSIIDFIYHGETEIFHRDLGAFLKIAEELELKGLTEESNVSGKHKNIKDTSSSKQDTRVEQDQILDTATEFCESIDNEYTSMELDKDKSKVSHFFETNDTHIEEKSSLQQGLQAEQDQILNTNTGLCESIYNEDSSRQQNKVVKVGTQNFETNNAKKIVTTVQSDDYTILDQQISSLMEKTNNGWMCHGCGKVSKQTTHIRDHIESAHIEAGPHQCKVCGNLYKTRDGVRTHYRRNHK